MLSSKKPSTDIEERGEQAPLLMASRGGILGDDGDKPLHEIEPWTKRETAVAGVSAVSFAASVAAMVIERDPLVYLSGGMGVGVAPYATLQQQKITHVKALKETNKRVEEEVTQLHIENERLKAQVGKLSGSVESLKTQKNKLETIQSVQGASLDELEAQLAETKRIHGNMKKNLQGDILNNLIDIALACDEDEDMVLSDAEIEKVVQRLETIHGVELDNEGIRSTIASNGRSLEAVMEMIKNLIRHDIPKEESLFRFIQKKE